MAVTQEHVLNVLKGVQDPDLKRDIVSLGFIKNLTVDNGRVAFQIELTTPACPVRDLMRDHAKELVSALPGVSSVEIGMTSQVRSSVTLQAVGTLAQQVKNIIPIASGKGGVGKSTVSVNLALALARSGASVGLMDADVYGPSIPTMLGITSSAAVDEQRRIRPVERYGLKVVSMGFFIQAEEPLIWRGPMLHKTVEQFLGGVYWGTLDYLLIDLPPTTGDVPLSICQLIPITGAVIVSTPQDVALNVAHRGIAMFKKLNAPILGVIENMSAYVCHQCGAKEEIFGLGGARATAERLGLPFLGEIPLVRSIRTACDAGQPTVLTEPDSPVGRAFIETAERLAAQVSIRAMQREMAPQPKVTFY